MAHRTLRELRELYLDGERTPPPRLLRELAADPRAGARQLHQLLLARRSSRQQERKRVTQMLHFETVLWRAGVRHIAGVDEVGMGPLAGPVVAAAVILPSAVGIASVDDSKRLDAPTRERLDREIRQAAIAVSVAEVAIADIDRLNIYHAGREAMRRAISGLAVAPDHVLSDAREVPGLTVPQNAFEKGDGLNYSIACASIVAKVHRDRLMTELAKDYPGYGFDDHKGYGTPYHLAAIRRLGPCPQHRQSFPVIRQLLGQANERFYALKDRVESCPDAAAAEQIAVEIRTARTELAEDELRKLGALLARRRRRLRAR